MEDILNLTMSQRAEIGQRIGALSTIVCPSKAYFAKSIGITPQNLYNWINRGANLDAVELITDVHKQVNSEWLITGIGEPVNDVTNNESKNGHDHNGKRIERIAKYLCSNLAEFARMLGEKPITVKSWIANGVNDNVIDMITSRFPSVNRDYLTDGTGKPLFDDKQINKRIPIPVLNISLDTLGGRISYIIANTCKSKVEFSNIVEESPATVQRWCKSGAPLNKLHKILDKFPVVNSEWLFNGKGLPFNDNSEPEEAPTTEESPSVSSVVTHQQKIDESIDMGTASQSMVASQPMAEEAITQTIQMLSSAINSLTAQLSDKDRIIIQKLEEIASKDERIRQLEKMLNEQNNPKP